MQPETPLFVIRDIKGVAVRFGKLSPRDRAEILRQVKAQRKELLLANLQSAGIDKEQVLVELEHFDDRPWGQAQWLDYLNTIQGQEEAVRTGYARCNAGDAAAVIDAIESADGSLLALAAELCNLRVVRPTSKTKLPEQAIPEAP